MDNNKFVWHDIFKNPQDLPNVETNVLTITNKGNYCVANYWDGVFVIPNKKKDEKVISWKFIEPYGYETGKCGDCKHCVPCKQLIDKEWKYFKICKLFANEPDGWCVVVDEADTCENFLLGRH